MSLFSSLSNLSALFPSPNVLAMLPLTYERTLHRDLPVSHQAAMVQYMACEAGDAWGLGMDADSCSAETLALSVQLYGDYPMGMVILSADAVKVAIMKMAEIAEDFPSWDEYHAWYMGANDMPSYGPDNRWPVIIGRFEDEVLQDGWHRLHAYIAAGHTDIPALFYLD